MIENIQNTLSEWRRLGVDQLLIKMKRGLEKESLRICPDGHLALTPHPKALGAALTHPYITTDFSEALLEFITPAFSNYDAPIEFLRQLHQFTYQHLGQERLWVSSMPCVLPDDAQIPIAQYGTSNLGRLKMLYREGLGRRYGRAMQTIAGIHYNVSFPDELWLAIAPLLNLSTASSLRSLRDDAYFHIIRNFQRYYWLLILLMGASPQVCRSFLRAVQRPDAELSRFATSLRMSDLGYQNSRQGELYICHNNLNGFVTTLDRAIHTLHPPYQSYNFGSNGQRLQLNDRLLQIENEYYAPIRPKRALHFDQRPLSALRNQGVEYLEVRCLDLNPYMPVGIDAAQMRCIDLFLLTCLLLPSPLLTPEEVAINKRNVQKVVNQGRDFTQTLCLRGQSLPLAEHAHQLLEVMQQIAVWLDNNSKDKSYHSALQSYAQTLVDPQKLLSARIVADTNECGFFTWSMQQSQKAWQALQQSDSAISAVFLQDCQRWCEQSWLQQAELESASVDFENYLHNYLKRI